VTLNGGVRAHGEAEHEGHRTEEKSIGLSRGRMPNPDVRGPFAPADPAFDRDDAVNLTITAVVGAAPSDASKAIPARESRASTFLPDGASDAVSAPARGTLGLHRVQRRANSQ
jgi:hypothetical protein